MFVKPAELAEEVALKLKEKPHFFSELLRNYSKMEYRAFLLGWSELRIKYRLDRDEEGRYLLKT